MLLSKCSREMFECVCKFQRMNRFSFSNLTCSLVIRFRWDMEKRISHAKEREREVGWSKWWRHLLLLSWEFNDQLTLNVLNNFPSFDIMSSKWIFIWISNTNDTWKDFHAIYFDVLCMSFDIEMNSESLLWMEKHFCALLTLKRDIEWSFVSSSLISLLFTCWKHSSTCWKCFWTLSTCFHCKNKRGLWIYQQCKEIQTITTWAKSQQWDSEFSMCFVLDILLLHWRCRSCVVQLNANREENLSTKRIPVCFNAIQKDFQCQCCFVCSLTNVCWESEYFISKID